MDRISKAKRADQLIDDIIKIAEYYLHQSTDIEIDRGKVKCSIIKKINEFVKEDKKG